MTDRALADVVAEAATSTPGGVATGVPYLRAHEKLHTYAETQLMLVIADATEPLGGRVAARLLAQRGIHLSEATVARLMRRLDARGLTRPAGTKGRVPTDEGKRLAASLVANDRRSEQFSRALDVRNVQDAIDVLEARRGVEREAARSAALRSTSDDLAALREGLQHHERALNVGDGPRRPGLQFHRLIGRASHNKLLKALMDSVLAERLDAVEQIVDVVTRSHGTIAASAPEHHAILLAIEAHDPDAAEAAMVAHLDRLIAETLQFAGTDRSVVLEQLLALVRSGA